MRSLIVSRLRAVLAIATVAGGPAVHDIGAVAADTLPTPLVGTWSGVVAQRNPDAELPVSVRLDGGETGEEVGTVDYPSQGCGGRLVLDRYDRASGEAVLREELTRNAGGCVDGGIVTLRLNADGDLAFAWRHPTVDSPAAGTLLPVGVDPAQIAIERIGLAAPVEGLQVVRGVPEDVSDPWIVAWYRETGRLGVPGNVVMAGALEWWGLGPVVFANLDRLRPGDRIVVTGAECTPFRYRVTASDAYARANAPVADIFSPALGPTDQRLTLLTDQPPFDEATGRYQGILVVRAERDPADDAMAQPDALSCRSAAPGATPRGGPSATPDADASGYGVVVGERAR